MTGPLNATGPPDPAPLVGWSSRAERPRDRAEAIDVVFGALADPTRRLIVQTLARGDGASASALARALPITRQGVAKHLGILEQAGLVVRRPHGTEIRYRTDLRQLEAAMAWMAGVAAEWDDRLAALLQLASEPDEPTPDRPTTTEERQP